LRKAEADYLKVLQELLPPGLAWPRLSSSSLTNLLRAFAAGFKRVDDEIENILSETDPRTAILTFDRWEHVYGLPDGCIGYGAGQAERRASLLAKRLKNESFNRAYIMRVANMLGYDITYTEYRPFVFGLSRFGDRLNGPAECRFYFKITFNAVRVSRFQLGISAFGEPLSQVSHGDSLICILSRKKLAHLVMTISYIEDEEL
jgi:uncharacterized protein YmfQ (DUF2313 family)